MFASVSIITGWVTRRLRDWLFLFEAYIEIGAKGIHCSVPTRPILTSNTRRNPLNWFLEFFYGFSFGMVSSYGGTVHAMRPTRKYVVFYQAAACGDIIFPQFHPSCRLLLALTASHFTYVVHFHLISEPNSVERTKHVRHKITTECVTAFCLITISGRVGIRFEWQTERAVEWRIPDSSTREKWREIANIKNRNRTSSGPQKTRISSAFCMLGEFAFWISLMRIPTFASGIQSAVFFRIYFVCSHSSSSHCLMFMPLTSAAFGTTKTPENV